MRDWQKLVRDRLARLELDAADREEVCAELAAHLEEEYQSLQDADLTEQVAMRRVLAGVGDWRVLQCKIESSRKKEFPMTKRVAQFWLPALVTLLLSMVLLAIIQIFGPNPWVSTVTPRGWRFVAPVAVVYLSWLFTLPFIGALGAYLSKRAGGPPRAVFSSVVFPVLPYLVFFVIALPIAVILDDHIAQNMMVPAFFVGLCAWVIFPAAALLAGSWPIQFLGSRRLVSNRGAGG